jgi:hypothetical protein
VTERLEVDGAALVRIVLRTTNAFSWIVEGQDLAEDRLALGHRFEEVLTGAEPAFAESVLIVSFLNGRPGSPLPDLVELAVAPRSDRRLVALALTAWTEGPLAAGFGVPAGIAGFGHLTVTNGAPGIPGSVDLPVDRLDLDSWGGRDALTPLVCCASSAPIHRAWAPAALADADGE